MAIIASGLVLIGGLALFIGWIMVLIKAFSKSILWGLGSLFIPIIWLIFAIMNWADAKKGFLIYLGGMALLIVGAVMGGLGGRRSRRALARVTKV